MKHDAPRAAAPNSSVAVTWRVRRLYCDPCLSIRRALPPFGTDDSASLPTYTHCGVLPLFWVGTPVGAVQEKDILNTMFPRDKHGDLPCLLPHRTAPAALTTPSISSHSPFLRGAARMAWQANWLNNASWAHLLLPHHYVRKGAGGRRTDCWRQQKRISLTNRVPREQNSRIDIIERHRAIAAAPHMQNI